MPRLGSNAFFVQLGVSSSEAVEQAGWAGAVVSNDAMGEPFLILAISEASVACNLAAIHSVHVPTPIVVSEIQGSCTAAGIRANYVRFAVRLPALQAGNVLQISGDVATAAWLRIQLTCHPAHFAVRFSMHVDTGPGPDPAWKVWG